MKIQNFAIIFLVIAIPIILLLAYYLHLQQETLRMQIDYNAKLSEATKEGIETYEINSVELETLNTERENVEATINSFITSLSNKLNIYGTAREYIENYLPAIVFTAYDGYYTYAPNQVLTETQENTGIITVNDGKFVFQKEKIEKTEEGTTKKITEVKEISDLEKEYSHTLSSKIPYSAQYTGKTKDDKIIDLSINYTLDNRVYIYGTIGGETIDRKNYKDGYLVYFDNYKNGINKNAIKTQMPKVWTAERLFGGGFYRKYEWDLKTYTDADLYKIIYKGNNTTNYNGITMAEEGITIEPEILEEQIEYMDGLGQINIETFKYIYTVEHSSMEEGKLYYDEGKRDFFYLTSDKKRSFISQEKEKQYYKTLSILWADYEDQEATLITKFIKLYQPLNPVNEERKGIWYYPTLSNEGELIYDDNNRVEIDYNRPVDFNDSRNVIYYDYSAISYYVESFALTNWVRINLGEAKDLKCTVVAVNETNPLNTVSNQQSIFKIDENNDPETEGTAIVAHRKKIMRDNIIANLNLAISNYNNNNSDYHYQIPVLTEADWEKLFRNISLLTFFQGVPIGLKEYNNYAIETSTINKEYVDPYEIYFSSQAHSYTVEQKKRDGVGVDIPALHNIDENFHRINCKNVVNEATYTGYRAWEYKQVESKLEEENYYKHDVSHEVYEDIGPVFDFFTDENAELACYYCIINKSNYTHNDNEKTQEVQNKSYNEALARERYYQKEKLGIVTGLVDIHVTTPDETVPNMMIILDSSGTMNTTTYTEKETGITRNQIYSVRQACTNFLHQIGNNIKNDIDCNIIVTHFDRELKICGKFSNIKELRKSDDSNPNPDYSVASVMAEYDYDGNGSRLLTALDSAMDECLKIDENNEWVIIIMSDRNRYRRCKFKQCK